MSLPTSRENTQNTAAPIRAALLNAVQDAIIGAKRPSIWSWINASIPNVQLSGSATYSADSFIFSSSNTFGGMMCPRTLEGDRITGFGVRHKGLGVTGTATYSLYLNRGDGSPTILNTLTISNAPATWATYVLTLGTPHVMASGESLFLGGQGNASFSGERLAMIGIQSDRL